MNANATKSATTKSATRRKAAAGSIRPEPVSLAAQPIRGTPVKPFKTFARTFGVGEHIDGGYGQLCQVVTEWWDGRPDAMDAIEDPETPGVWVTQRIHCPETGEVTMPIRDLDKARADIAARDEANSGSLAYAEAYLSGLTD